MSLSRRKKELEIEEKRSSISWSINMQDEIDIRRSWLSKKSMRKRSSKLGRNQMSEGRGRAGKRNWKMMQS